MTMTGIVLILDESGIYNIDSICCFASIYLSTCNWFATSFFHKCQWQWHCHMLFCEARQCQRLGPGIFVCGSWAWRAEYPIQSYLESLLPPPSPHPLKQSKTLQYSAEYIRRSEYPFHSYLKPTASPAASQNTIIGSNPHRSTCSIVNTQTMVIWDHLHLQQTRWVEIISASSSQPQPP